MALRADGTSASDDGPQCPKCGFTITPDEGLYFDEHCYTEDTCSECGTEFRVEVSHSVSWWCEPIEPEPARIDSSNLSMES
jgi:hypothetical protein